MRTTRRTTRRTTTRSRTAATTRPASAPPAPCVERDAIGLAPADVRRFQRRVLSHYRRARRDLPFRGLRDPYAIWVAEIMAQQTRLSTVVPYWQRWMQRFPTIEALAAASEDEVMAAWSGLGYYARARSLHRAAREVARRLGGRLPDEPTRLAELPGIGRYTAGAIASIAFGRRAAVVDGNVARVFARYFGISDDVRAPTTQARLWTLAEALVPAREPGDYNQGLMDLGATLCAPRNPTCSACPLADGCTARREGRQGELPVLSRRAPAHEIAVETVWVVRGGRWLLARRAARGLFGGLWELPALEALRAAGVRLTVGRRPLAEHVQKLSHRTIRYRVFGARLLGTDAPPIAPPYEEARFFSPDALASLGVSSATTALARALHPDSHGSD